MSLPPILVHVFDKPLPYVPTLALQHRIHAIQLARRREAISHPDVLLLLQHRPTYTGGRRQKQEDLTLEEKRLKGLGAEWVTTERGGETTFHGPGQIVGYPLLDLGRMNMSIRTYICRLQVLMQEHVRRRYEIRHHPSDHTGLFVSNDRKLGSIGVQVRHRLTTHGFAFNVTNEPLSWFNQVVACGLADVRATGIQEQLALSAAHLAGRDQITAAGEMPSLVELFKEVMNREAVALGENNDSEIFGLVDELEKQAVAAGNWPLIPKIS
ncbi:hypothetical protein FRC02_006388 [Tulasnella sp. 418]|nr:hypothetical protein FRC02_006388 [Tulasnella sp. 418]